MKYRVEWEETVRCSLVIDTTSKKAAENLVLEGQFDKLEVEKQTEFSGISSVKRILRTVMTDDRLEGRQDDVCEECV